MYTKKFTKQLNRITKALLSMTPAQREVVHQSITRSHSEFSINELIQPVFDNSPQCPHCHGSHIRKWGKSGETQRYKCMSCQKTFNNKTKTPLARLRKCSLWQEYTQCMVLKLTLREAADICKINLRTSFLWRHRFLIAQSNNHSDKLSGIIEADEFFMAYSEKGAKKLSNNRAARHRGNDIDKRKRDQQVPVLLSIDRSNHIIDKVLSADTGAQIRENLSPYITENSVLCSDGAWAYVKVAKEQKCDHKRLINNKNRVIEKIYHIQTVNGVISNLKAWINGKMKGVATKYLSHYLAWNRESYAKLNNQQILLAAYR
jgi:transposase-like protein